jgi:hypothetical protein
MSMKKIVLSLSAVAALLCLSSVAQAQATRTWVSGVGDDANPCSRTAPCKTFAGAISKTAAGGEISVLDPGGFGGVTITKSISIVAEGGEGGILAAGTFGVTVNAGVNDVVNLRGLIIEGAGTGLIGVRFLAGKALHMQKCVIRGFGSTAAGNGLGISFAPNSLGSELLVQDTTISNNFAGGVLIKPAVGGSAKNLLDRAHIENNTGFGYKSDATSGTVNTTFRDSVSVGNGTSGIHTFSGSASVLLMDGSASNHNGTVGIISEGASSIVRLNNATVTGNATGMQTIAGGSLASYSNNHLVGNGVDVGPTTTIPVQ